MRRAYAYTLLVVLSWSISLPTAKALLLAERAGERLTPLQVAFWSIGVGWVALAGVLGARGRLGRVRDITPRGWLVLAAMGLCGWAGYTFALNTAFVLLPLPDAIVINYLHPVFVVLFQGSVFGAVVRRVSGWEEANPGRRARAWRLALGLGLALVGVAVIATRGRLALLGSAGWNSGALAALGAAFGWGVYSNLGRFVAVRREVREQGMGDVQTWLAMTFGVVMLGGALAGLGGVGWPGGYVTTVWLGRWGPIEVGALVLVAFMGVVVYCGGYTLWLVALEIGRRAGEAHKLPPLTYLTPVLGVALGWILLHEPFGAGFWQGAGLIAAGNGVILASGSGAAVRARVGGS